MAAGREFDSLHLHFEHREETDCDICWGGRWPEQLRQTSAPRGSNRETRAMTDRPRTETAAMRLAEISREIDELEKGRIALLKRVESTRVALLSAGDRAAAARATVDLMCEHAADAVVSIDEILLIEDEIREMGPGVDDLEKVSIGQSFEADSLTETSDETEQEIEQLSSLLIEGKTRNRRGH